MLEYSDANICRYVAYDSVRMAWHKALPTTAWPYVWVRPFVFAATISVKKGICRCAGRLLTLDYSSADYFCQGLIGTSLTEEPNKFTITDC